MLGFKDGIISQSYQEYVSGSEKVKVFRITPILPVIIISMISILLLSCTGSNRTKEELYDLYDELSYIRSGLEDLKGTVGITLYERNDLQFHSQTLYYVQEHLADDIDYVRTVQGELDQIIANLP
jgi:hypothetical protein